MHKKHYLREWREWKGYSLERVAEELEALSLQDEFLRPDRKKPVGTTHQNLGKIERGTVQYSQTMLEMLARIYGTEPASLIMRNPLQPEPIFTIYDNLTPTQQKEARQYLEYLAKRDGTNG